MLIDTYIGVVNILQLLESTYHLEHTKELEVLVNRFELIAQKFKDGLIGSRESSLFEECFNGACREYFDRYPDRIISGLQQAIIFKANKKDVEEYFFERYKSCALLFLEKGFRKIRSSNSPLTVGELYIKNSELEGRSHLLLLSIGFERLNDFKKIWFKHFKNEEQTIGISNKELSSPAYIKIRQGDNYLKSVNMINEVGVRFLLRNIICKLHFIKAELKEIDPPVILNVIDDNVQLIIESNVVSDQVKQNILQTLS